MSSCVMLDVKFIGITYPDVNGNDFSCLFDQFRIGVFQVVFFFFIVFLTFCLSIPCLMSFSSNLPT